MRSKPGIEVPTNGSYGYVMIKFRVNLEETIKVFFIIILYEVEEKAT